MHEIVEREMQKKQNGELTLRFISYNTLFGLHFPWCPAAVVAVSRKRLPVVNHNFAHSAHNVEMRVLSDVYCSPSALL